MTGSRRPFAYFSDAGTEYIMVIDETYGEDTDLGFGTTITASVFADPGRRIYPSRGLPLEPRYILCTGDVNGETTKRKFYVGATSAPVWSPATSTVDIDGVTWSITYRSGEKVKSTPQLDTGLTDGDAESVVTPAGP